MVENSIRGDCNLCMCVCCHPPFILDVRLVDAPAGVTQEEGHTGFLHLPSAVLEDFVSIILIVTLLSARSNKRVQTL